MWRRDASWSVGAPLACARPSRMARRRLIVILALVAILASVAFTAAFIANRSTGSTPQRTCSAVSARASASPAASTCRYRILVFSKTGAFRHASIPDAIAALKRLAAQHSFDVDFTEDALAFNDANLARYNAVVFLMTTGHILAADQQAAFERYIRAGGGYVGVHSASDTEYDWAWYGRLLGAYFDRVHGHSHVTQASVHVVDGGNPSTSMLPRTWVRTDEWYNFATNPGDTVHVLLTVDETTYQGGVMGAYHPIAWYHLYDGGRAWYTAMGHTSESYREPLFLAHLWGGIVYAACVHVC